MTEALCQHCDAPLTEPLEGLDARACPEHGIVQVGPTTLAAIQARKAELADLTHVPVRGALVELMDADACPECGSRSLCRLHSYAHRRWYETVLLGEEFFPGAGRIADIPEAAPAAGGNPDAQGRSEPAGLAETRAPNARLRGRQGSETSESEVSG